MASRLADKPFDGPVSGTVTKTVKVPRGAQVIQVVVDRTKFESLTDLEDHICAIGVYDSKTKYRLGGCTIGGGRIDYPDRIMRPGTRSLWSTVRLPTKGAKRIEIKVDAPKEFACTMDVDFF